MELSNLLMFSSPKSKEPSSFVLQVSGEIGFALEEIVFVQTSFAYKNYDMPLGDCSLPLKRAESKETVVTNVNYFRDCR